LNWIIFDRLLRLLRLLGLLLRNVLLGSWLRSIPGQGEVALSSGSMVHLD
jgi:hypothetical protein